MLKLYVLPRLIRKYLQKVDILENREMSYNEQSLFLPQCFHLYSICILSCKANIHTAAYMFQKPYAIILLYVRKGLSISPQIRFSKFKVVCF